MNIAPYSLQEAEAICKEFQHLVGSPFTSGSDTTVQCITVTPYRADDKGRFMGFYFLLNDAKEALIFAYTGSEYDVMVIATAPDRQLLHESLYSWLPGKEISTVNRIEAAIRAARGVNSNVKI